jgi:hypothetical protein
MWAKNLPKKPAVSTTAKPMNVVFGAKASAQETEALLEEGIGVMPLVLPVAAKEPLQ